MAGHGQRGDAIPGLFSKCKFLTITNYKPEARGFQGYENEFYLDLEKEIPDGLKNHFDVVFNHTTLEHIYEMKTAFSNLCSLSRDIVIIVLPFMQQYHSDYGDYWRVTPLAIKKMFEENDFHLFFRALTATS